MQLAAREAGAAEGISMRTAITFAIRIQRRYFIDDVAATGRQNFDLLSIENVPNDNKTISAE